MIEETKHTLSNKDRKIKVSSPIKDRREPEYKKISFNKTVDSSKTNTSNGHQLPKLNLKSSMMSQSNGSMEFYDTGAPSTTFNDNDICKMLKFNRKYVDKKHLKHKKNLLESLFKVNFDSAPAEESDDETSPMLTMKPRRSPYGSPMRANTIIQEAKNTLKQRNNSFSHIADSPSKRFKYASLQDYSSLSPKYEMSPQIRSLSYSQDDGYGLGFKSMKSVKYNPKADRTISIRKKFSQKKASIKAMSNNNSLNNSPAKKKIGDSNHRNEVMMKNYSKIMKASNPTEIFDKIRKRKKHERYLEEMNNGIFGRFAKRNIQNQVKSQPEDLSGSSPKFISRTFGLLQN
ncbi:unnamed protein product [Moneuplotes crassus]|uniref:Uncharacterized protein n=1 Tax=Euplotes crassus TaxID=5936 RepID=A0AAD1UH88_EUPCR|nr:unnamed protein product [Moneuplotes crassus]